MAEIGGGAMLDRRRALATGLMATGATAMLPPTMAQGADLPLPGSQPPAYYRLHQATHQIPPLRTLRKWAAPRIKTLYRR